jgi:hypothetical protein
VPPTRQHDETKAPPEPAAPEHGGAAPPVQRVLGLQASIGNAATARLLRDVGGLATPESPVHPEQFGPPMIGGLDPDRKEFVTKDPEQKVPPEIAAQLVLAQTALKNVIPLKETERATLRKAIPGAPIVELIERREMRRGWLENLPSMIGSLSPPAGQPDEAAAYQIWSLEQTAESYRKEIEEIQPQIDALVAQTGAKDETELLKLVTDEFPKMFVNRAKYIAYRQLWDNLNIAEAEGKRYGVGVNPDWGKKNVDRPYVPGKPAPEEAPALRAAAKELIGFRTRREEAERNFHPFSHMEDEYEAGKTNPDPSGAMALQEAESAEREARTRVGLEFPVLFNADLDKIANASDEEVSKQVCDQLVQLDMNIKETITNIREDNLKVWNLRGIVDLTMIDMGIDAKSPLVGVIQKHIAEAEEDADDGMLNMALTALQITAAVVATIATGGVALVAAGVAVGIGAYQLSDSIDKYMMESAAEKVALDPEIADISINEPQVMPIVFGVLALGLDGAAAVKVIAALRGPARALLSSGDMPGFIAAANRALPEADAARLIERASLMPEVASAARGVAAPGHGWTAEEIQDLFTRAFKRPGPPEEGFVLHPTVRSYRNAAQAAGVADAEATYGFFQPASRAVQEGADVTAAMGKIHLPPTASTITVIHESLHAVGRQSGVSSILGRYVDEGLTELIAREAFGPEAARFVYEGNMAFVKVLAKEVGGLDVLRNAYLHRQWGPLRSALRARLGGKEAVVQRFYRLMRRVGPNGEDGEAIGQLTEMLFPTRP